MAEEIITVTANGDEIAIPYLQGAASHWEAVTSPPNADRWVWTGYDLVDWYRDLYALSNHVGSGTIANVRVYIATRVQYITYPGYTAQWYQVCLKTNGVIHSGNEVNGGGTQSPWTYFSYDWATNPATGLAWTWTEVDALQAGARIKYDAGDSYGVIKLFNVYVIVTYTTLSVTTEAASNVSIKTATGNGTIVSIGASAPTQHGHCWSTSANPTTADNKTENGVGSVGAFTSAITGLLPNTLYHTRAYATDNIATAYGDDVEFTTQKLYPRSPFIPKIVMLQ